MILERPLDAIEIRVLGCLLEKQQTTPEYYPLTLSALVAACNQRSSREPVMDLTETEVGAALLRLAEQVLVWSVPGARAERWEHNLDRRWQLDPAAKAIVTLLFLRGPQTPGELRGRAERMHAFASPGEAEAVLRRLAAGPEPMVAELPRGSGQKEVRWAHLAGGPPAAGAPAPPLPAAAAAAAEQAADLGEAIARLEARVAELEAALASLREMKRQVE